MTRGARRLRAFVLALGALVVLLAPMLVAFHKATQRHAICSHGAEVHATAASPDGAVGGGDAGDLEQLRRGPAEDGNHDEHHHCTILASTSLAKVDQAPRLQAFVVGVAVSLPFPHDAPLASAILLHAPKTSPPLA